MTTAALLPSLVPMVHAVENPAFVDMVSNQSAALVARDRPLSLGPTYCGTGCQSNVASNFDYSVENN